MERNFIGYGQHVPRIEWPGGARIAVSVVVSYEEGAEHSLLDGDSQGETAADFTSPIPINQRDLLIESFFEYGSRVGIWRILDLLEKHQVVASFFASALALERNLDAAKQIIARGHEVCGHGYRWEESHLMDRETERQRIKMAVDSIARSTGDRPLGWHVRMGPSLNTRELLVEEGGFVYDCNNAFNDDLPYYVDVKGIKWLVIPYAMDVNDGRAFRGGGAFGPTAFLEIMSRTFDYLYEEGKTHPKMMSIGLHCRVTGRPALAWALDQFLQYAKGFAGVWFPRRIDIARWWLKQYPAS